MTLEELKKLYAEKGATEQRITPTEQGDVVDYIPIDYGGGYGAFETANEETGAKSLGGFSKKDGDYISFFDPTGKMLGSQKWNKSDFQMLKEDLGPIAMAALSGYLGGIPLGETGLTAGNALNAARAAQNKDVLGLLSSGAGAFDTAGIDFGGMSAKDIAKYASLAKGLTSGGAGTVSALAGLSRDENFRNLTNSLSGWDTNPNEFTEGYFLPGGEGYIDPNAKNSGMTGAGYYDETTGQYINDPLGGLQNPLGPNVGNLDPNQTWEYSLKKPGVWVNAAGEEIDLSYLPNTEKVMTGAEIMQKAGAMPSTTGGTGARSNVGASNQQKSGIDLATLLSLLGKLNEGSAQPSVITSQDPYAHIKLMEEIFGPEIDLTPAGEDTEKRK